MVDSTPNKPLFAGNYPSNAEKLFFEFAFEPTPLNFTPQPDLITTAPLAKAKRKTFFLNASKLAFGLLITALLLGSGILNNKLLLGNAGNQASLSWIPSWGDDAPTNTVNSAAATNKVAESSPETILTTQYQAETTFAPTEEPVTALNIPTAMDDVVESGTDPKENHSGGK